MRLLGRLRRLIAFRRRLFGSRIAARVTGRRHLVVLGDSHAKALRHVATRGWLFDVEVVEGATASGIRNPNSVSEALPRFRRRLAEVRPWQAVMVMLGEVDCGYVVWRRARSTGVPVRDSLAETVTRYGEFIRSEVAGRAPVLVMSAPLPTLPDDASDWGVVAQKRADVPSSQRERTELTLAFNEAVRALCAAEGWRFVDSATAQLDPSSGLIRRELVRPGASDHHLETIQYRQLLVDALDACPPAWIGRRPAGHSYEDRLSSRAGGAAPPTRQV